MAELNNEDILVLLVFKKADGRMRTKLRKTLLKVASLFVS
jgi:hypothetical protein